MRYFDMFSGIGGFSLGIGKTTKAKCIGYAEIDKYATAIYNHKFKGIKNYGDVSKLRAEELPDFDLLVGGFPCQSFSIAGKRKGFDDTRGTLFFDVARVLTEKRPRYLVLENVKGLLSHDKGKTFQTILGVLTKLGYRIEWQVLNSKHFGVPQNRERVFIVGHLGGNPRQEVFPIGESNGRAKKIYQLNNPTHSNNRVYDTSGISPTLNAMQGGNRQPNIIIDNTKNSLQQKYINSVSSGMIRRLTPIECERLQGFPDNWTKYGMFDGEVKEMSNTQRYKCLGNAVTVNVVSAVINQIKEN